MAQKLPVLRVNALGRPVCDDCGYAPPQHTEDCSHPTLDVGDPVAVEAFLEETELHCRQCGGTYDEHVIPPAYRTAVAEGRVSPDRIGRTCASLKTVWDPPPGPLELVAEAALADPGELDEPALCPCGKGYQWHSLEHKLDADHAASVYDELLRAGICRVCGKPARPRDAAPGWEHGR